MQAVSALVLSGWVTVGSDLFDAFDDIALGSVRAFAPRGGRYCFTDGGAKSYLRKLTVIRLRHSQGLSNDPAQSPRFAALASFSAAA